MAIFKRSDEKQEDLIFEMRKKGVLRDVSEFEVLDDEEGVILVACGDGHRIADAFLHQLNFAKFVHVLALNGGPLRLHYHDRGILLRDIEEAIKIKSFHNVVLLAHWPCAIAKKLDYSIRDIIEFTLRAQQFVEYLLHAHKPKITVSPQIHIDYRGFPEEHPRRLARHLRTYTISPENFYAPSSI